MEEGARLRYGFFESIREYAEERLRQDRERAARVEDRHAAHYLEPLATQRGFESCHFLLPDRALGDWVRRIFARAHMARGLFWKLAGRSPDAVLEEAEAALALAAAAGLERQQESARYALASAYLDLHRVDDARRELESLVTEGGSDAVLGMSYGLLDVIQLRRGRYDEARESLLRGIAHGEAAEDFSFLAMALRNLAVLELHEGRFVEAYERAKRGLELMRRVGRPPSLPMGDRRVDLGRRRLLRRILAELVAQHRAAPGESLPTSALIERVWAGDRSAPASLRNRLWKALSQLRHAGLAEVLVSTEGGYFLEPRLKLEYAQPTR